MAAVSILGIGKDESKKALETFKGVEGRRQEIETSQDFRVIVDFAHTPNALEQVLKSLKSELKGRERLIAVFGSAGLRDKEKRPKMGEVAGRLADLVVLTAEDPRTEKVEDICAEIARGCQKTNCTPVIIDNRTEAIEFAVNEAKKGDVVVICGKGHEKSMCYGKKEYPWSDTESALEAIKKRKEKK
jgi:UDP-N-acetylmuramoyl-L-alanyl-D-glutamate--2,6-diaminopimelate ligase